jgi:hypothetical protein
VSEVVVLFEHFAGDLLGPHGVAVVAEDLERCQLHPS